MNVFQDKPCFFLKQVHRKISLLSPLQIQTQQAFPEPKIRCNTQICALWDQPCFQKLLRAFHPSKLAGAQSTQESVGSSQFKTSVRLSAIQWYFPSNAFCYSCFASSFQPICQVDVCIKIYGYIWSCLYKANS